MLRIAVCDDNSGDIEAIKQLLEVYAKKKAETEVKVDYFLSTFLLLEDMDKNGPADIYILDIYIDAFDGIGVARSIRRKSETCAIIFLTSSTAHAVDAFGVRATHYLEKPATPEKLAEALDRCMDAIEENKNQKVIYCQTEEGLVPIQYADIVYVESDRHRQAVILKDKRIVARRSLAQFWEILGSDPAFIMPHRSYIINQKYIRGITPQEITLKNGDSVPLPRGKYKEVKAEFMEYSFENSGGYYIEV